MNFSPVEAIFTDLLWGGRGVGRWAYRLDVICEPVLSADELNNGQELKGLVGAVNLRPPSAEVKRWTETERKGPRTLSSAAA